MGVKITHAEPVSPPPIQSVEMSAIHGSRTLEVRSCYSSDDPNLRTMVFSSPRGFDKFGVTLGTLLAFGQALVTLAEEGLRQV
jgi:hypothetical protein